MCQKVVQNWACRMVNGPFLFNCILNIKLQFYLFLCMIRILFMHTFSSIITIVLFKYMLNYKCTLFNSTEMQFVNE